MLVKILGGIDLLAALIFLFLVADIGVLFPITIFCAGLLLLKGMFVFLGDLMSIVDWIGALVLILSTMMIFPTIVLFVFLIGFAIKGGLSFL